jgi:hypothetical protein
MSDPRSARGILIDPAGAITTLAQRCNTLQALTDVVRAALPQTAADHCRVANISGTRAVLHTDSPVWSTLLRFHIPHLLAALQRHPAAASVSSIQLRVKPTVRAAAPHTTRRTRPSRDTAHLLITFADTCEHGELQKALRSLANRLGDLAQ